MTGGVLMKQTEKTAKDENFPVGSMLMAKHLRPHVAKYYKFARKADDIADNPSLSSKEKVQQLDDFEAVLHGQKEPCSETHEASDMRRVILGTNIPVEHSSELLKAFKQDAIGITYNSWADLIAYCRYSAAPVGRFMLDLHEENNVTFFPSDNLGAVLQVLNHLQDCKEDYIELNRVYIPKDWLKKEGLTEKILKENKSNEAMQRIKHRILDAVEMQMQQASPLPSLIHNSGLRLEVSVIMALAERLIKRLRKGDVLAKKVGLTKLDWFFGTITGVIKGIISGFKYRRKFLK